MRDCPIVEVTWDDAFTNAAWVDGDEVDAQRPVQCLTVGRLFKQTKRFVTVIGSVSENGSCGETTTIPAGWVTKISRLRGGKTVARKDSR